jgi:hypothetical protein
MVISVSMQSYKEKMSIGQIMKNAIKQAKPFNRLVDFGFTADELLKIKKDKEKVANELDGKLVAQKNKLIEIEKKYKNGTYDKEQYLTVKKEATKQLTIYKKKIKGIDLDFSETILDKASNTLNAQTVPIMSSKFLTTDFVLSKAKVLSPLLNEGKAYKTKWREILQKESHQFPDELKTCIKALEVKRKAIYDLLSFYGITRVRDIEKLNNSLLNNMLKNMDAQLKEYKKRLKDPEFDLKIRVQEATRNQATTEILTAHKKRQDLLKAVKKSVKEGDAALKKNLEKREKQLNALMINGPKDHSNLFTPSVSLTFRALNVDLGNPLHMVNPTPSEEIKDRRKSVRF